MNTKKFSKKILSVALLVLIIFICSISYMYSVVTIKIIISEEKINTFIYDTLEIHPKDYQTFINKIEKMRFSRKKSNPQSREMYLYVYIQSVDGSEEIICCNDDLITHIYDNRIIEKYKIPSITQHYIKTQVNKLR